MPHHQLPKTYLQLLLAEMLASGIPLYQVGAPLACNSFSRSCSKQLKTQSFVAGGAAFTVRLTMLKGMIQLKMSPPTSFIKDSFICYQDELFL